VLLLFPVLPHPSWEKQSVKNRVKVINYVISWYLLKWNRNHSWFTVIGFIFLLKISLTSRAATTVGCSVFYSTEQFFHRLTDLLKRQVLNFWFHNKQNTGNCKTAIYLAEFMQTEKYICVKWSVNSNKRRFKMDHSLLSTSFTHVSPVSSVGRASDSIRAQVPYRAN